MLTRRLDANRFKPSKSQRKLLNRHVNTLCEVTSVGSLSCVMYRWNRFVLRGDDDEEDTNSRSADKDGVSCIKLTRMDL